MANPSLQIGNSNWAIKEDNLLGYSTAGTRFVPQPITMTRASAGTRVNSSGLVETVELLGSDLTSPLNFLSTWLEASVDSKTYNTFTVGGSGRGMYFMLPENKTLKINVSGVTGSVELRYRTTTGGAGTVLGDFDTDLYLTTTNATTNIYLRATAGGTVSVTDISVKESTKNNLARVDYDGTASSLLVEPQRTNEVTYSSDFSNWSALGTITVTTNDTTSPSGGLTADKVLGLDSASAINQIVNGTSGIEYTNSCYIKNLDATSSSLLIRNGITAVSSLLNWSGSVLSSITNNTGTTTFTDEGNGWYRLISTYTSLEATQRPRIYPAIGTANTSVYLWGAQLEEGSYATSYIPTDGSTVTRVQDQYEKTGISNLINSEEGVLFAEMAALANDGTFRIISLTDGGTTNRVSLIYNTSNNNIRVMVVSTSTVFDTSNSVTSTLDFHKIAIKWKLNDFAVWIDGVEVATDTSGNAPVGLDRIVFDVGNGTLDFFGKVKQLQVFKTALTDSELATLTT